MVYRRFTPAGHLIRQARERAGMSQQEMAERSGVAPGRVSDYEMGKLDPRFGTLLRLLATAGMAVNLCDADECEFANPERSGLVLADVLSFADAIEANRT